MRTAWCFYTNGRGGNAMRDLCHETFVRVAGDAEFFTLVAGDAYAPLPWERVVDANARCKEVFGVDAASLAGSNPANRSLPLGIFSKYLIPLIPEFRDYDVVVSIDDDIEVVHPSFRRLADTAIRPEADVAMVADHSCGEWHDHIICRRNAREWWARGCRYHNGGIVVFRGSDGRDVYRRRVKQMFDANMRHRYFLNEEAAANQFLAVQSLPAVFSVVPYVRGVQRAGAPDAETRGAWSLHYAGARKKVMAADWASRAERGEGPDYKMFEREVR